jgi:hypothetical protein
MVLNSFAKRTVSEVFALILAMGFWEGSTAAAKQQG